MVKKLILVLLLVLLAVPAVAQTDNEKMAEQKTNINQALRTEAISPAVAGALLRSLEKSNRPLTAQKFEVEVVKSLEIGPNLGSLINAAVVLDMSTPEVLSSLVKVVNKQVFAKTALKANVPASVVANAINTADPEATPLFAKDIVELAGAPGPGDHAAPSEDKRSIVAATPPSPPANVGGGGRGTPVSNATP